MASAKRSVLISGVLLMVLTVSHGATAQKLVIAHRGASAYLPEHTLESKAMAYAMGADYVEQDVVMTQDNQLIVLHDITLERTTDVARQFPGRARADGSYYVVDFTLAEIRQLRVNEGVSMRTGERQLIYPQRFPLDMSAFRINTLAEEIEMVQGLNHSTGKDVGIYPEVKSPAFHRAEGKDVSRALLEMLKSYGYVSKQDKVFVQTFEFEELKIIHDELQPALGIELNLVQLMGADEYYEWMLSAQGMTELARYADGIGPEKGMIIPQDSSAASPSITNLVEFAHAAGLQVHPYTFRADPGQVPGYASDFASMLRLFYFDVGVDGVFTDFPDLAVGFLQAE